MDGRITLGLDPGASHDVGGSVGHGAGRTRLSMDRRWVPGSSPGLRSGASPGMTGGHDGGQA